ncbi:MAG TPA: ATP-binding protein [Chloroflexota bacterium]|nr:ATP-binding protein [Chloroflexota bacterium]
MTRGPDHVIDLASPRFLRAVGWDGRDSPLGQRVAEAFPVFSQGGASEILDRVYRDGQPIIGTEVSWPVRRDESSETAYFNVVWQPVRDHHGTLEGVLFLGVEVSELVRTRQRIEELAADEEAARARLEAVLAQLPAGVMIVEAHTERFILANSQVEQIFRRSLVSGGSVTLFFECCGFQPDGQALATEDWPLIRSIRFGETVFGEEIDIVRGDGSLATIRISSAPITDREGRPIGGVATIDDVSDRKRSEDAIRFLAESSQVLSQSLDLDGTVQVAAGLAIPRLADISLVFLADGDLPLHCAAVAGGDRHPEIAWRQWAATLVYDANLDNPLVRAWRRGAASRDSLYELLGRPTGESSPEIRSLAAACVPLIARGQIVGAVVLARRGSHPYDSTDLAIVEELARRVAIALDNARLYQLSQEALRARDQFLSFASHDLKNPLTAIKGTTQLLQRRASRLDNGNAERFADGLANIDAAATRMTAMISELLDVARLQMGETLSLNREPTDLVALTHRLVAQHRQANRGHRIDVETAETEIVADWDGPRLERVLDNLLSNAVKYGPERGEVKVTISREQESGGVWAVLRVSDQGIGIPKDDLPHIFESFRRATNAVRSRPGVGLGLAGSRQIVTLHGGQILVDSREGEGSTFTVRLPL